jgi:hypothetical protein
MDDLIVENVKRGVVDVAKSEVSPSLSLPSHGFSRWRHASSSRPYISSEADLEINISHCTISILTIDATGHPETMG